MERRLVELAMRGDEEAFDLLVGQIGDGLHSVAHRILRDTTLARDATKRHSSTRGATCHGSGIPTASKRGPIDSS